MSGPGSCVGEERILENGNAVNSVEALGDTFTFRFTLKDIRRLTMDHPRLALVLVHFAALKTNQAEQLFVALE